MSEPVAKEAALINTIIAPTPSQSPKHSNRASKISLFFPNIRRGLAYEETTDFAKLAWKVLRASLTPINTTPLHVEDYQQAITRLGLTNQQLSQRQKHFLYAAIIYAIMFCGFFGYELFLLNGHYWLAATINLLFLAITALLAYREHLWYMQMKQQRLGCTFADWIDFICARSVSCKKL